MKDIVLAALLAAFSFTSGVVITAAFGAQVKAFIFKVLDKSVAKIEGK